MKLSDHQEAAPERLTWRARWVLRRNRVLGSAAFQRWAARTPFFRGVARRRAAAQFDLVAGFVYTQILTAFVEAGLVAFLAGGLRHEGDVARMAGLTPDAADRLLRAAAALELAESPQPGWWTLGEAGAPLIANPGALAMIRHHRLLYADLADPLALLRAGRAVPTSLSAFWSYARPDDAAADGSAADYSALMAATQPMIYGEILERFDFSVHRRMLDIGGGSGAFVRAVGAAAPHLALGIFDLPEVIAGAAVPPDTVTLHGGSFRIDPPPPGYDLVTLVRILHDHDDDVVEKLLRSIFTTLPPGGRLLIAEPMAENRAAPRMGDAYFGLYLWAMGSGRPRSMKVLKAMLTAAGFARVEAISTAQPVITSAIVATK
jgi:demethylspheroidene O-methyltransferase